MSQACICCSGKKFEQCCDLFLNQKQQAKTPEQLMRSRYAAFALGGYGQYLLATWLPEFSHGLDADSLSIKSHHWAGLEIVDTSQKGSEGFVEFKAMYLDAKGAKQVHHEHSAFVQIKGCWFYTEGIVS